MSFTDSIDFSSSCGPIMKDSNISENLLLDMSLNISLSGYSKNKTLMLNALKQ